MLQSKIAIVSRMVRENNRRQECICYQIIWVSERERETDGQRKRDGHRQRKRDRHRKRDRNRKRDRHRQIKTKKVR